MTAEEILRAATARTITLENRGVDIALLDWGGDGPLALLHHANGFCKGPWGLVAWELRRRFRVVAMDARGHGDSSKPAGPEAYRWGEFFADLAAVGERLATEHRDRRIALGVGHSFGGAAMICAAHAVPGLFERLLLVDPVLPPPPELTAGPEHRAHLERMVEGARRRRAKFASRAEARAWWSQRSLFARWRPEALDLYVADGLRDRADGTVELKCPGEVEAAVFAGGPGSEVHAAAAGLDVPTRILWAARGNFPRGLHESVAASMRDARVDAVDAGHLVPMERPDLVVAAVAPS